MKPENEYVYELLVTTSQLNQHHQLKPFAYQMFFEQMAEQHLSLMDVTIDGTMKYGMSWALISMSVDVVKPITSIMELYGNTWHSERRGPYFRRELIFKDKDGQEMFRGSTHSVLIDIEKRTVYRKKDLPFRITPPTGVVLMDAQPGFKMKADLKPVTERVAMASHIDPVGHVNNCRYGEFAYDLFDEEEQGMLNNLKKMDIHFISELRYGDRFTMKKAREGDQIFIQGYNNTKDNVSFNIIMTF